MSTTADRVQPGELHTAQLFGALEDPALNSMNFLNEISSRYPDAVSLAAGRPAEQFFEIDSLQRYLDRFCQHLQDDLGYSEEQVRRTLFQYGRTKGIVHGLIAANLARDEGITVDPESIVVTVGCQEAMFLILRALRTSPSDVLLAVTPTYVGLTGAARLVELPVLPVAAGAGGVDLDDLRDQLDRARAAGLRPRACYVMPDFANPSGVSMDIEDRKRLLAIAADEGILLLEDNPYGLFPHADSQRQPTLKALDEQRTVVYLGSFAKTAMPGVRVGYLVADQSVVDPTGGRSLLADQLSKLKSMLTVNTSPIAQAIVGGKLLDNDCSLLRANERERAVYTANMRQMVAGLAARFPDPDLGVRWNVPIGGFFVVVTVPFVVDDALLERSAADYGVLWTSMHHFYEPGVPVHALRLSCSTVTPEEIERGLDRVASLIKDQLADGRHG
ncbi:MAG: (S)-3,5-dihydroxyphenylglycine transaminase [Pseudonocardiales bacterium]|jgi:(S)-3,5-dihydroxyphenylglycine transaminase|nr:(S)-3,5-dihydroxyphenylglycine transaminase [Pseudonocardiales bacterium]